MKKNSYLVTTSNYILHLFLSLFLRLEVSNGTKEEPMAPKFWGWIVETNEIKGHDKWAENELEDERGANRSPEKKTE